jgi:hypothetical protein
MSVLLWMKSKIALYLTVLGAVAVAVLKIRQGGKQAERNKTLESTLKSVRKKEEVIREVERLPDGSAADRLRKQWSRD